MSKLINIALALLLLISTVGITVDKHYCEGHYIGTWFYVQEDACDMDMPMAADSCQDDVTLYSVQSEFQLILSTSTPSLELIDIVSFDYLLTIFSDRIFTPKLFVEINPPPSEPNIYTKVQSFLL